MIYVILGMHKSGTTLVSQILHHSGINMGGNIDAKVSYDRGNKYERDSVLELNLEILGLKGYEIIDFDAPGGLQITEDQRARMRKIIRDCNKAYVDWGFKDPRTALVYPMWASELPEHKIIAIYRPLGEIWPRFRYKPLLHFYKNPYRAWQLANRWWEHNSRLLDYLQNTSLEFIVLSYREFMTDDGEFDRLQEFVGKKLSDQRKKDLYRNRSEEYLWVKIATWLVYKQTGYMPEKIIEQFEALRQR